MASTANWRNSTWIELRTRSLRLADGPDGSMPFRPKPLHAAQFSFTRADAMTDTRQDGILIRPFHMEDREAWEPLWQGYLTFYESSLTPEVTDATWGRLLDPSEPMHGLAALLDGAIVGIVH